jgi:predicted RNase H-like nuclease
VGAVLTGAVVGADVAAGWWVAIVLRPGAEPVAVLGRTIADVAEQVPDAVVFGIDIPIGLADHGVRRADVEARRVLGPRASSLFTTPIRDALLAPTHAAATAVSVKRTGQGISRQAYGLREKVFEVDAWLAGGVDATVAEVHPELSFATMAGGPLAHRKKSWAGMVQRRSLLAAEGIVLADGLGPAGDRAAPDDVLDAAAAAWTARRVLAGTAVSYPEPPEPGPGRPMAIWA